MESDSEKQVEPKLQLELIGSSGDGRNPRPRTAVGQEEPDTPQYFRGEHLKCRVTGFREGGYQVQIIRDGLIAYLKSDLNRELGEEFSAEFECWRERPPL